MIARHGGGFENVDVAAATSRGIVVVYTPTANSLSVAEHTLTIRGALAKRILPYGRAMHSNSFYIRNEYCAQDVDGKTLKMVEENLSQAGLLLQIVVDSPDEANNLKEEFPWKLQQKH